MLNVLHRCIHKADIPNLYISLLQMGDILHSLAEYALEYDLYVD